MNFSKKQWGVLAFLFCIICCGQWWALHLNAPPPVCGVVTHKYGAVEATRHKYNVAFEFNIAVKYPDGTIAKPSVSNVSWEDAVVGDKWCAGTSLADQSSAVLFMLVVVITFTVIEAIVAFSLIGGYVLGWFEQLGDDEC